MLASPFGMSRSFRASAERLPSTRNPLRTTIGVHAGRVCARQWPQTYFTRRGSKQDAQRSCRGGIGWTPRSVRSLNRREIVHQPGRLPLCSMMNASATASAVVIWGYPREQSGSEDSYDRAVRWLWFRREPAALGLHERGVASLDSSEAELS